MKTHLFVTVSLLLISCACGGEGHKSKPSPTSANRTNTDSIADATNSQITKVDTVPSDTPSGNTATMVANNSTVREDLKVSSPLTPTKIKKATSVPKPKNPEEVISLSPPSSESFDAPIPPTEEIPEDVNSTSSSTLQKPPKPSLSHDIFDGLLKKYVNAKGRVNYDGMKQEKQQLAEYIMILQNNPPQKSWSKNKQMAYWINLYNAFTIQKIVARYPVASIMDLEGGNIFDKATIDIGGKNYTLNQIEKEMLLRQFREPRVHFAVNCAAASCPPLLSGAWTEANIQKNYEKMTKAFINNPSYNKVSTNFMEISKIFEWYADDFGGSNNLINYFNKYANIKIKSSAKVRYLEYDWKLNRQ